MEILQLRSEQLTRRILNILGELSPLEGITVSDAKRLLERQIRNRHTTYVVYVNGVPIGLGSLLLVDKLPHGGKPVAQLEDIVITEEYRDQGYGYILVQHLVEKARKAGCRKIILNCSDKNLPFYTKCGFYKHENEMRMDL